MKNYLKIYVKFIERENAYRIWGINEKNQKNIWLPGLSHEVVEIPYGVKTVAEELLKLEKNDNSNKN